MENENSESAKENRLVCNTTKIGYEAYVHVVSWLAPDIGALMGYRIENWINLAYSILGQVNSRKRPENYVEIDNKVLKRTFEAYKRLVSIHENDLKRHIFNVDIDEWYEMVCRILNEDLESK